MAQPPRQYSWSQHGGLEVVPREQEGLQLDRNHQSDPIRMPTDAERPQFLDRSNLEKAEIVRVRQASVDQPIPVGDDGSEQDFGKDLPGRSSAGDGDARKQRRFCGLSRKWFILFCVVAAVVVIAAVVGGVLGSVLSRRKAASATSSNHGSSTQITVPGGGFALATDPDGGERLLMYYGVGSALYENVQGDDDTWSQTANSTLNVTDSAAGLDSPIAAIAYYSNGAHARQVFFQDDSGIMLSSTSKTIKNHLATAWTAPEQLAATPGSTSNATGLAACVGNSTDGLNGIRVYYGTNAGLVQELQYSFGNSPNGWTLGMNWTMGDAASGIGCVVNGDSSQIDVYWRNSASGTVQQASRAFGSGNDTWALYNLGNVTMAQGSDIAVCLDDAQTEYVFFQDPSGTILRGSVGTSDHKFGDATPLRLQAASNDTKLAATWTSGDAWYLYQNTSNVNDDDSSRIWLSGVNRNGADAGGQVAITGRANS